MSTRWRMHVLGYLVHKVGNIDRVRLRYSCPPTMVMYKVKSLIGSLSRETMSLS